MARESSTPAVNWPDEPRALRLELVISPQRVTLALLLIAGIISLASLTGRLVLKPLGDFPGNNTLIRLSDVTSESSVGTWFSSLALALCSAILALTTLAKRSHGRRDVLGWAGLSLIFLYLSVDEGAVIHEAWLDDNSLDLGGPLYYAWVIPGSVFAAVWALVYLRFLATLPADIRRLFLIAAALLIGGAVGMEMAGGWLADSSGEGTTVFALVSNLEELLEMVGTITFLYALMVYSASEVREVRARFSR